MAWLARRDTLFVRLLLLILMVLLLSNLSAWWVVTRFALPAGAPALTSAPPLPASAPGAPTMPGPRPGPGGPGGPGPGPGPRADRPLPPQLLGAPMPNLARAPTPMRPGSPQLPTAVLLLDYGVRLLFIVLAAWWGARWLAAPVKRMVDAARTLDNDVARGQPPAPLDEAHGTAEVREAARVFNQMAERLARAFRGRGLLMAAISHDLRTPLTRMRLRLEGQRPAPLAERCIADIAEMNELIDGAIGVFRAEGTNDETLQATDVFALVQSLADDHEEQGRPVVVHGQRLVVPARPQALRRALGNLIANAWRYAGNAEVTVLAGDKPCVRIEDRGPGIPEEELALVLEPFHRVERSRSRHTGGTGLGLHIAHSLLLSQGATLTLANRPGGGLSAEVNWPPGS